MKAVKLKLGTYMDNGLKYYFYQNLGQGLIIIRVTSLDRFYNFAINEKFLSHFSREL